MTFLYLFIFLSVLLVQVGLSYYVANQPSKLVGSIVYGAETALLAAVMFSFPSLMPFARSLLIAISIVSTLLHLMKRYTSEKK